MEKRVPVPDTHSISRRLIPTAWKTTRTASGKLVYVPDDLHGTTPSASVFLNHVVSARNLFQNSPPAMRTSSLTATVGAWN
jgi:hypothetical protein